MSELRDKVGETMQMLAKLPPAQELKPGEMPDLGDIARKANLLSKLLRAGAVVLGVIAAILVVIAIAICIRAAVFVDAGTPDTVTNSSLSAVQSHNKRIFNGVYAGNSDDIDKDIEKSLAAVIGVEDTTSISAELDSPHQASYTAFLNTLTDFDYKVTSTQSNGDIATAKVTVTSYNLEAYFNNCMSDYLAQSFASARYTGNVSNQNQARLFLDIADKQRENLGDKDHSIETTLNLVQEGGRWKLAELDEKNLSALTGGFYSALKHVSNSYYSLNNSK